LDLEDFLGLGPGEVFLEAMEEVSLATGPLAELIELVIPCVTLESSRE